MGDFYRGMFNGPAAVIIFFLISGLCIHFPNRRGDRQIDLRSFYTRRLIRIGLPFLCTFPVVLLFRANLSYMRDGIFWSLICEIVYYLIYPGLLRLRRRFTWQQMIAVTFVAAAILLAAKRGNGNYASFGDHLNWILGLPCWLLGCLIAERSDSLREVGSGRIWLLRFGALIASSVAVFMRWHLPHGISIGFQWTLDVFALYGYIWLCAEVGYYKRATPNRVFEAVGVWSYSLYLMHLLTFYLWNLFPDPFAKYPIIHSLFFLGSALLLSFLFYLVVERPSHQLAVKLGRSLQRDTTGNGRTPGISSDSAVTPTLPVSKADPING